MFCNEYVEPGQYCAFASGSFVVCLIGTMLFHAVNKVVFGNNDTTLYIDMLVTLFNMTIIVMYDVHKAVKNGIYDLFKKEFMVTVTCGILLSLLLIAVGP